MMMHSNRFSTTQAAVVAALAALAWSTGCAVKQATPAPGSGNPEKFLYEKGHESLHKRRWFKAREYFRELVDNYPQSPVRPEAKLGLADAYLSERSVETLVLAVNEYREFLTFYPTHPRADYAQYRMGLAAYEQILHPQRDQTQTREAIREFETFIQRFPNSMLLSEANSKLRQARDRLSDADYQIGVFYYRTRWYPGAVERFRSVLKTDPEYSHRDGVLYYMADCYMKVERYAEALPLLDRMIAESPRSEFLERAKQLMAIAKSPPPPTPTKPAKKTGKEPGKQPEQKK